MRGHNTPKSSGMPVEVNAAAVQWSNVSLPGEIHSEQSERKSAEVIVAEETSRGQHARLTNDTGEIFLLRKMKRHWRQAASAFTR